MKIKRPILYIELPESTDSGGNEGEQNEDDV